MNTTTLQLLYSYLDFVWDYLVEPVPERKTRKVKPIWIFWCGWILSYF